MCQRAILITVATLLVGTCQPAAGHDGDDDHPSNDVEVLQPPAPEYPALAAALGAEGYCEVRFSLHNYGKQMSVDGLTCSHLIFCKAAFEGMMASRFKIIDVTGAPIQGARDSIVYPLEFAMEDGDGFDRDGAEMINCLAPGSIM